MTTEARRFPIGLTIAVAIAFTILVGLGTWQLQRLQWKEDLLARIVALQAAPARPLEPVLEQIPKGGEVDFTRVKVECIGISTAPMLALYSVRDGVTGVRLISACRLDGPRYQSVLVDRGFIADGGVRPDVVALHPKVTEVVGVLRKPDRGNLFSPANTSTVWYTRDVAAMASALQATAPAPVFLFAETSSNPDLPYLVPVPVPVDIPNNHFAYALTWYGLAAALLGVYAAMLFRKRTS